MSRPARLKTFVADCYGCRRAANPLVARQSLPAKAYCLAYAPASSSLVVSMAHRNVYVYDVRKMEAPTQKRESALKFMTRSVACMVDGKGERTSPLQKAVAHTLLQVGLLGPSRAGLLSSTLTRIQLFKRKNTPSVATDRPSTMSIASIQSTRWRTIRCEHLRVVGEADR